MLAVFPPEAQFTAVETVELVACLGGIRHRIRALRPYGFAAAGAGPNHVLL